MTRSTFQSEKTFREALGGGVRTRLRTGWSLGWVSRRKSSCRPGTGRKCKKSSGANRRAASARERSRSDTSPQGFTTTATGKVPFRPLRPGAQPLSSQSHQFCTENRFLLPYSREKYFVCSLHIWSRVDSTRFFNQWKRAPLRKRIASFH